VKARGFRIAISDISQKRPTRGFCLAGGKIKVRYAFGKPRYCSLSATAGNGGHKTLATLCLTAASEGVFLM